MKRHPLDVCVCGDYRRDHKNGTGPCTFGLDLSHGFTACNEFRLSHEPGAKNAALLKVQADARKRSAQGFINVLVDCELALQMCAELLPQVKRRGPKPKPRMTARQSPTLDHDEDTDGFR